MDISRLTRHFGSPQRVRIIDAIKRRDALSIRELAAHMNLSYMGAKQHCVALEKEGFLATWRRPREGAVGRPELAYRLTRKADLFFPESSNAFSLSLLRGTAALYGALAPEKILLRHFEEVKQRYRERLRGGSLDQRIAWMAKLRDADGYMATLDSSNPLVVIEKHSPLADVAAAYACVAKFEQELYSEVVGASCRRVERDDHFGRHCEFRFDRA